jgi:hypothetical protein
MINSSPLFAWMVFHVYQSVMLPRTLWPTWSSRVGQVVFPKACFSFPDLRFPRQRNMDASSTQYFLLHYIVVMLSQGNITYALLGMIVYAMEVGKIQAVCLSCRFILRLPDPFASHRCGTLLRGFKYPSLWSQFTMLLAST